MIGYKARLFKEHVKISLEDLVPKDNFYRHVEENLDLTFVRDLTRSCYSPIGRPSIDPVVFFKLQLIMFFESIRSERKLMKTIHLNLAHRWYICYDLDEEVPDHSSLSKIRERYGVDIFQKFFEKIVELCIQAGLVWGEELYFDGTKVKANAARRETVPRFYHEAKQHLTELFEEEITEEPVKEPGSFIDKYNGSRLASTRASHQYKRITDYWVSPTDPDASPMRPTGGGRMVLGYHNHYVVDGGKARIILAALVTPASIMDNSPMLDLAHWLRFRWRLKLRIAVGDAKYGTVANIVGLEQNGIKAYLPEHTPSRNPSFYPVTRFQYDAEHDLFRCPKGHELTLKVRRKSVQTYSYHADALVCNTCPLKPKCTSSKNGRRVTRSFFQNDLDRVRAYQHTEAYKKAMHKRKLWPEPLFAEAKQWHHMRQFRLRTLRKVNMEGLLIATGQNLKRLLSHKGWGKRHGPAGWEAIRPLFQSFSFI